MKVHPKKINKYFERGKSYTEMSPGGKTEQRTLHLTGTCKDERGLGSPREKKGETQGNLT